MGKIKYGQAFHILNIVGGFFLFGLAIAIILLIDSSNLFWGKIAPIVISGILIALYTKGMEVYISRRYRYSWVRSINKKYKDENESYNLYKIDPKIEKEMDPLKYQRMVEFRIVNTILYFISVLVLIFSLIDFDLSLWHDIVLPIIMIVCGVGILFVCVDLIEESLIKHINIKEQKKPKTTSKETIYTKNLRIYYIPICIFIGIILVMGVVDFSKSISDILKPTLLIAIIDIIFMIVLDFIITKTIKFLKLLDEESNKSDDDMFNAIDNESMEEKKRGE